MKLCHHVETVIFKKQLMMRRLCIFLQKQFLNLFSPKIFHESSPKKINKLKSRVRGCSVSINVQDMQKKEASKSV